MHYPRSAELIFNSDKGQKRDSESSMLFLRLWRGEVLGHIVFDTAPQLGRKG